MPAASLSNTFDCSVRTRALNALLQNYAAVIAALDEISDEPGSTGSKAAGFVVKLKTFECFFGLSISKKIFAVTEQLAIYLQNASMTLSGAMEHVTIVLATLDQFRSESNFK